ncbi:PRC-barrel domain-containing protein [Candidatus Uhrbacteria bacterium]|nr:PRC-barrel domain-containing protein [Candidatus Uhrbacteria bacterium]
MNILQSKLLHLPVQTQSGQVIGRVVDWSIDVQTQTVTEYLVRPFPYIPLVSVDRTIARASVIDITADAMIVDDGAVPVTKGIAPTPAVD